MTFESFCSAAWAPLGYDADVGCKALDQIDCGSVDVLLHPYLQAVRDRRPAVLENKEPMPRAKILEFFDVCNTRMDLPETHKELLTYIAEQKKIPNELIISIQRELLEDLGFEQEHGCAVLSRIGQDYPNDVEVTQKMKIWKSKAEQSCLRAVKAHQDAGGEAPEMPTTPVVDKDLALAMEKVIPKAKEEVSKMSEDEKQAFLGEKAMKKLEVFQGLPPDGRNKFQQSTAEVFGSIVSRFLCALLSPLVASSWHRPAHILDRRRGLRRRSTWWIAMVVLWEKAIRHHARLDNAASSDEDR
eukprot:s2571_g15.t1